MQESARNEQFKFAVAVASGKGGVGKSTVAVNMAVALAAAGKKVGLLDADIYGPNIPTMMGVHDPVLQKDGKMVPIEAYGVKLMSIGFLVPEGQPLIWRGPMLHSAIKQFVNDVAWGELDYLIVDLPPGTGDAQISLSQSLPLDGGIIVTLPQKVSIEDAQRGLEMFRAVNVPVLGVLENMSYLELEDGTRIDVFGQGGGRELAKSARVEFLGEIPMNPAVRMAGDNGVPVVLANPETPSAKAIVKLAERIIEVLTENQKAAPPEIRISSEE
ncbi:MAG: Mrp/NBP35 family ATP-binding protein [Anaerolineales bacterium]|nr:Mrp/NBP35 family ATP-binding protein [Anaerolineales bacterium]